MIANEELRDAIMILRQRAQRVGPQHALWDVIFDAEALIEGKPTILPREEIVALVEREVRA